MDIPWESTEAKTIMTGATMIMMGYGFCDCGVDYYGNRHLSVFTNENGSLSKDVGQSSLSPLFPCMVQWVDVQSDGFLDLVTIGADSLGELGMRFLNDSTYQLLLSSSWSSMNIGTTAGAFEFGDFNDDGLLDFALIGNNSENSSITNIYKY